MRSHLGLRSSVPGTVDVTVEDLGGRPVVVVRSDPAGVPGPIDRLGGESIAAAADTARRNRLPLLCVLTSGGPEHRHGVDALDGWGRAARAVARCSGVVPVAFVLNGPMVAGPALLLGMADLVVVSEGASAYVVGPATIRGFTGEVLTGEALGGVGTLRRQSGVACAVAPDEDAALELAVALLAHLPSHCDEEPPPFPTADPTDRDAPELADLLPAAATGAYDVRDVARAIGDDDELLELWAAWAPNLVTAFLTIGGRPVGVVANQPLAMAGTLDIPGSQKGARFVDLCDAFNVPLLTLVDTPGFFPGKDTEWRGMIRHGAQLVAAYARATVPRVCLVLRKAYGGAYIVMDSRRMGNDVCLAWPTAELAVMGAEQAMGILHRRATPEERATAKAEYERELVNPWVAASRGYVDDVIAPTDSRRAVAAAFELLRSKREHLAARAHDNLPM